MRRERYIPPRIEPKGVDILIGTEIRALRFTLAGSARFKKAYGKSIDKVLEEADEAANGPGTEKLSVARKAIRYYNVVSEDVLALLLMVGLTGLALTPDEALELIDQVPGENDAQKRAYLSNTLIDAYYKSKGIDLNDPDLKKKLEAQVAEIESAEASNSTEGSTESSSASPPASSTSSQMSSGT